MTMGLILLALMALALYNPQWKHIEDIDQPGDIYLSRLMLIKTPWGGLYLHIIRREDWARCEHSHPWSFATFILRGGYEEEEGGRLHVMRPGAFGWRPRGYEHRITKLLNGPAVTLVVRLKNHHEWGFRTVNGLVPWLDYVNLPEALRVLWCDDRRAA